ncbi:hypothetical protein PS712_06018 [Pseudomonas fluorescens]|uniref:Uncharacterized protein n=1 Tax=Pseudomonas fluorescens TaxID=294 RepID=A0A5E7FSG9_PSEFL|nr:hypothetical protein PS712_06018 [Pseudomonas fluorescens]
MSSSTPSRSCCRSWITPLIISNGISNNRISRAIAPSLRVRLRSLAYRRQTQTDLDTANYITDRKTPTMQLDHFLDKI